jgi:hypothetical protein
MSMRQFFALGVTFKSSFVTEICLIIRMKETNNKTQKCHLSPKFFVYTMYIFR